MTEQDFNICSIYSINISVKEEKSFRFVVYTMLSPHNKGYISETVKFRPKLKLSLLALYRPTPYFATDSKFFIASVLIVRNKMDDCATHSGPTFGVSVKTPYYYLYENMHNIDFPDHYCEKITVV